MEFIIKIGQFLLSLSFLIVLHEFGHYLPARLFKTRVEKFFLFFDVKFALFQKKIGETIYGIGWLPLGGYVKISGMIDESMDTEAMAEEPKEWEFRSKPAWQRLIIMLGGVTVNFLLAWLIYIGMMAVYGETYISNDNMKDGYEISNPLMQEMGFQSGDKVVSMDGKVYEKYTDIRANFILANEVVINRNGSEKTIALPQDFLGRLTDAEDRSTFELRFPFIIDSFNESSLNKEADINDGDQVIALNGIPIKFYEEIRALTPKYKGQTLEATIVRDGAKRVVNLKIDEDGKLGIYSKSSISFFNEQGLITSKEYSLGESIGVGSTKFVDKMGWYWGQLQKIFTPSTGAYKGVGGFKAIYDIFPDSWDWENFWSITALLSIMLGVLNLLPIPALDGGHVTFLLYEMVTGRKPGDKFLEYAQVVGFFLLIALVLFANGNDIYRAIFK
ncbi:RIP metalloprotease RseP [Patiriisocius sp. Uisw_047]|jgi:regulator of sigma E protease|uniref:RIP metalloprotease RseP n=1 Tax=Patiriisocius sp. Uisw_047 TaxID=3230969 RepID=UPI0039E730CE